MLGRGRPSLKKTEMIPVNYLEHLLFYEVGNSDSKANMFLRLNVPEYDFHFQPPFSLSLHTILATLRRRSRREYYMIPGKFIIPSKKATVTSIYFYF